MTCIQIQMQMNYYLITNILLSFGVATMIMYLLKYNKLWSVLKYVKKVSVHIYTFCIIVGLCFRIIQIFFAFLSWVNNTL